MLLDSVKLVFAGRQRPRISVFLIMVPKLFIDPLEIIFSTFIKILKRQEDEEEEEEESILFLKLRIHLETHRQLSCARCSPLSV